jgi:hypothetical protein
VFTARYGLSPYATLKRFVLNGLNSILYFIYFLLNCKCSNMVHIQFLNAQQAKSGTLKMVAKATETCTRILIYDKAYFVNVFLLVYCISVNCSRQFDSPWPQVATLTVDALLAQSGTTWSVEIFGCRKTEEYLKLDNTTNQDKQGWTGSFEDPVPL